VVGWLRRLALGLAAGIFVWVVVRPALDAAVTGGAQILLRAFEVPRVTRMTVVDHRAEVRRADFRSDSALPTVPLTAVHFNTVVLLALYLSLPRPFSRRRLERLLMGATVLYLTQVLNVWLHVKWIYATGLGEWSLAHTSEVWRNVLGFLRYFADLPGRFAAPVIIWLAFDWDTVARMLMPPTKKAATRRR
jgi:hypothetical protein